MSNGSTHLRGGVKVYAQICILLAPCFTTGTAVCRELASQKSGKQNCACAVLERSKEKLERIAFRFFGSCKNCVILSEKLEMVKVLVDELECDPMSYNLTALHVATACGNLSMLKYLIENKKCDPYVTDVDQLSILHHSVEKGQLHNNIQYLINDLKLSKDSHFPKVGYSVGVSLLSRAAMYGHIYLLNIY